MVCQICHRSFSEITAEHLREHGFTLTRYRVAFDALTRAPGAGPSGRADDPASTRRVTAASVARDIVSDPQVIRELAGEVSEAIFSSTLRDKLRLSLVAMITRRLEAHGHAAAALDRVRSELAQPWRVEQGGQNGAPTPTKDLVAIGQLLAQEVKTGEELLLRTVKVAVEEWRSHKGQGVVDGGMLDRFTGSGEAIPVPAELTAGDRETIRTLWGMMDRAVSARRALTIDVQPAGAADDADDGAGDVQDVAGALPGEWGGVEGDARVESYTPSRACEDDEPF